MQHRRRFKQITALEERLADEAKRLREEAKLLPPGADREALLRKARQAETGAHLTEWITSPGLQPIARQSGWEARDNQDGESVSRRGDDCRDDCRAQEFC
jgi:hypothetical protein